MRHHLLPLLAFVLLLLPVTPTAAQLPVTVLPPNPTSSTPVTIRFMVFHDMCGQVVPWSRNGNTIRIDIPGCASVLVPPQEVQVNVGALPAGAYTYEFYFDNELVQSGSFVVAQALPIVPTLSEIALGTLCALLAVAGWFVVARR